MLSFIPTPIGNKEDITLRALRLLEELDILFCEDTRTTKKLLRMYDIDYRHKHFHVLTSFTDESRITTYIQLLKENNCGLVSEAGTPGLSDPGKNIVKVCRENEIPFEVVPGANALIPAVVGSFVDTSSFVYLGFIPAKKGRKTFIETLSKYEYPVFAFESVHRLEKLLKECVQYGYVCPIIVHRELSKMYEQKIHGTAESLLQKIDQGELVVKGEFVVCFTNKE